MKSYVLVLLMSSLLLMKPMFAQHLSYTEIDNRMQLPSNEVYQMVQDDFGYMYIGCTAGMFKYDGFSFVKLSCPQQNASSVSHLIKGPDGRIWCQNFAGQIYYVQNDSLVLFKSFQQLNLAYLLFCVDSFNNVWVGLNDRLICYDKNGNEQNYYFTKLQRQRSLSALFMSDDNCPVLGDIASGLFMLKDKNFVMIDSGMTFRNRLLAYSAKRMGYILVEKNPQRSYQLYTYDKRKLRSIVELAPRELAEVIYYFRVIDDKIYCGTNNGVFVLSLSSPKQIVDHFLPGENVSCIYKDKESNFWISTLGKGLRLFSASKVLKVSAPDFKGRSDNFTALKYHDEALYFGNIEGDVYRLQAGQVQQMPSLHREMYRSCSKIDAAGGTLYAARGIMSMFRAGQESIFKSSFIRDFCLTDSFVYYISSFGFSRYNLSNQKSEILSNMSCRRLTADRDLPVYLSSNKGVQKYDGHSFKSIQINNKDVFVSCLKVYKDKLCLATLNDGLYVLRNDKPEKHYTHSNGLRGQFINALYVTDRNLLVATENCIQQLDFKTDQFVYYSQSRDIELNGINALEMHGDTIYAATQNGLYFFSAKQQTPVKAANIRFEYVRVSQAAGNRLQDQNHFSYYQNNIDIGFKAISFLYLNQMKYRYRLLPVYSKWITLEESLDHVRFASLSEGDYTFEVQAVSTTGELLSPIITYKFAIAAPFWKQWWFIGLLLLLSAFALYQLIRVRERRIKKQADIKQQVIQSQLTALKAQMNPHFMFNALNSIQDLILQKDIKNSNLYLAKFSSLLRKILNFSEVQAISVKEEIEMLKLYLDLEQLRFGDDFRYHIVCDEAIEQDQVKLPAMLIQPFVENAIKHGLLHKRGNKQLALEFKLDESYLICTVTDNGVGRKYAAEIKERSPQVHRSFATDATRKRFDLLNGDQTNAVQIFDLYANDEVSGTKVVLKLKII